MTKIKVKVERTATGYSAYAEKFAAFTTGRTAQDLTKNMVEAINLYYEASGVEKVVKAKDIQFEVEMSSVFDIFPVLKVKPLAERVGMNYTLLNQYATGKKKPSPKQRERILKAIHQVGLELSELHDIR